MVGGVPSCGRWWVECLVSLVAGGIPLTKTPVRDPLYFWIVSVQRRHDRCVYTISHSKYICFCNFVILSFIWEKIQGDEVEVEKLLIVIFINRMRKNMSLAKRRFSEFNKNKCRFSEFSLVLKFREISLICFFIV